MADSTATVTPTDPATSGAQAPAPANTPAQAEGAEPRTAEPGQQQAAPAEPAKASNWAQRRINELTRDKYRERAERELLQREVEALRSAQAQAQAQNAGESVESPQQSQVRPDDVYRVAQQIADAREFTARCNEVAVQGEKEFKDFAPALQNVRLVAELFEPSGRPTQAMEAIIAAEHPHKVLHYFGTHPDEAAQVLSLPPMQLARAIGALEMRLAAKPTAQTVSNAPEPIKPISTGGADSTSKPDPEKDPQGWMRWRTEQIKAERKQR